MSASLVGSEMCIRDRSLKATAHLGSGKARGQGSGPRRARLWQATSEYCSCTVHVQGACRHAKQHARRARALPSSGR
eukprot:4332223-Alexandrium_andersonii.AAC.1